MMTRNNVVTKSLPKIEIDCIKSMKRNFKKSKSYFELKENKYSMISKNGVSLKIFANSDLVLITLNYKHNKNTEFQYKITCLPNQYHFLYLLIWKIIHKIRKKTVQYTLIRRRELDLNDVTTCLISLTGSYTIHFPTGGIAYLSNISSDIKFIRNNHTKTIPFTYNSSKKNQNKKIIYYNDAYDKLRITVNELIDCFNNINHQNQTNNKSIKTWSVEWNADSGSIQNIQTCTQQNAGNVSLYTRNSNIQYKNYESETTLSSDYSDTNVDMYTHLTQFACTRNNNNKNNDNLLSVVPDNSSYDSIKSEASWRNKKKIKIKTDNNTMSLPSINDDDDDDDDDAKNDDNLNNNNNNLYTQYLMKWSKQDVCCWLKKNHFSRLICKVFWNYNIDGSKLYNLTSNDIDEMFKKLNHVSNSEKQKIITEINTLNNSY